MSYVPPSDGWFGDGPTKPEEGDQVQQQVEVSELPPKAVGAKQPVDYEDPWVPHKDTIPQQSYVGEHGPPDDEPDVQVNNNPPCYCGIPAKKLQSSTARNPGRWFLKCDKYKDDPTACKYFAWLDEIEGNGNGAAGAGIPSSVASPPLRSPVTNTYRPPTAEYNNNSTMYSAAPSHNTNNVSAIPNTNPTSYQPPYNNTGGGSGGGGYKSQPGGVGAPALGGRDKSNDQCFVCQGYGHWSSECPSKQNKMQTNYNGNTRSYPSPTNRGSGGGGGYYNNGDNAYGGGAGGGGATKGVCYKCNEPGHWARDCPNAGNNTAGSGGMKRKWSEGGGGGYNGGGYNNNYKQQGGGGGYNGGAGYDYGGNAGGGGRGGGGSGGACFKCGQHGHWTKQCPN